MSLWRQASVWLPVAIAFGTTVIVTGFGLGGIFSSPAAVLYSLIFLFIAIIPGAVVGGIAVAATRIVDRLSQRGSKPEALLHAAAAGLAVGLATWLYMFLAEPSMDNSIVPVLAVSAIAAIAAASSARQRIVKPDATA